MRYLFLERYLPFIISFNCQINVVTHDMTFPGQITMKWPENLISMLLFYYVYSILIRLEKIASVFSSPVFFCLAFAY